jgi:hypothetical protein
LKSDFGHVLDGDEDNGIIKWTTRSGPVIDFLIADSMGALTDTATLGKYNV